jgi:hypothetical protein
MYYLRKMYGYVKQFDIEENIPWYVEVYTIIMKGIVFIKLYILNIFHKKPYNAEIISPLLSKSDFPTDIYMTNEFYF